MGDPFFFAILQEDWHLGQSTEDAKRPLFMSQVIVWSSLVIEIYTLDGIDEKVVDVNCV